MFPGRPEFFLLRIRGPAFKDCKYCNILLLYYPARIFPDHTGYHSDRNVKMAVFSVNGKRLLWYGKNIQIFPGLKIIPRPGSWMYPGGYWSRRGPVPDEPAGGCNVPDCQSEYILYNMVDEIQ